jgi:hypothetical protein
MMRIAHVLFFLGVATAASAQTGPVYEPIWATGQAIFRLHSGQPEIVYRHKSGVTAVGAGVGGRIVFLAEKAVWLLERGGTKPVKVGRAPRPLCDGRPLAIMSLLFKDRTVSVGETIGCGDEPSSGPIGTWDVKLPKPIETIAPVVPAELALDPEHVGGTPGVGVVTATSVEMPCGTYPKLIAASGGASVTLVDLSRGVTCDEDGNAQQDVYSEFGGATWLVGGHLLAAVQQQSGCGWTDILVLPPGKAELVKCTISPCADSDFALAPDSNGAICGGTYLGPKGEVLPLGPNAVWAER